MRVLFVMVLAFLILPLAGCGKEKDNPPNNATAGHTSGMPGDEIEAPGDEEMDAEMDDAEAGEMEEMEEMEEEAISDAGEEEIAEEMEAEMTSAEVPGESEFPSESDAGATSAEAPAGGTEKKGLEGFAKKVFNFFGGDKPAGNPTAETAPGDSEEANIMGEEEYTNPEAAGEEDAGEFAGEEGSQKKAPENPTDIPGVEKGTAEYAAVALILKVARGEGEGLAELIDDDAKGLLGELRAENNEEALAKAKELFGRVRKNNSRLQGRDTVIYYQNDKRHIVQFFIRKVQDDKYVVREIRDLGEATARPGRKKGR